ncbi:hypothetical protein E1J53_0008325 [Lewinella sp. W8]|nr:hypothetical protein [Lewinella sp. W8]
MSLMITRSLCLLALLASLLSFSGCEEEVLEPRNFSADFAYFPLAIGQTDFYRLDSIVLFNTVGGVIYDTTRLEVRETLVDTFRTPDGHLWYRGERSERYVGETSWRPVEGFDVSLQNNQAIRREDNLPFVKLVFPVREGRRWNGNVGFDEFRQIPTGGELLDVFAGWDYRYSEVDTPRDTLNLTFTESLLVDQANIDNLIDYRQAYERYAPGVGLIERFLDARHTQCRVCCNGDTQGCFDLSWDTKAEKGFIIYQRRLEN